MAQGFKGHQDHGAYAGDYVYSIRKAVQAGRAATGGSGGNFDQLTRYQSNEKMKNAWDKGDVSLTMGLVPDKYKKQAEEYIQSRAAELGRLNIDKPFTKNPTMTSEMYKAEIKRLIERGNKLCSDYNSLSWKKSELESNNRELMEKNEKLLHENDILKSQLDEYHKTEEIGFLLGLDENDEDSYGQDVIKRIVGRLKK